MTDTALAWQDQAACRGHDAELFFPELGDTDRRIPRAKKICAGCPVRADCLEAAMRMEAGLYYRSGVWGGLSAKQRRELHRCRTGRCQHTDGCPEVT